MADALVARLAKKHAKYIKVRDDAVATLANTLWTQIEGAHIRHWVLRSSLDPATGRVVNTLADRLYVTGEIHKVLEQIGRSKKRAFEYEIADCLVAKLAAMFAGDTRVRVERTVREKPDREREMFIVFTVAI